MKYPDMSVAFTWGEHSYEICFTFGVLAQIADEWGDDWSKRLSRLFTGSPSDIVFIARLATGGAYEEEHRVPFTLLANALYRGFVLAWEGRDIAEGEGEEGSSEKKTSRFAKFSQAIFGHGWSMAGRGQTSTS